MMNTPNHEAVERLEKIAKQSKRATVQLPQGFARDCREKTAAPMLARLLQRNGFLIKVYLTLVMVSTKSPHTTRKPAADIAAALDLSKPTTSGARRVNDALKQLETFHLIHREPRPGRVPTIQVLDARGAGEKWGDIAMGNPWITIPISLWSGGWLIALEPRDIALIVVLKELTFGRKENKAYVDGIRKRQYGLSDDTWTRATRDLENAGLLEVRRETYASYGEPRRRNVYQLNLDLLSRFSAGEVLSWRDAQDRTSHGNE